MRSKLFAIGLTLVFALMFIGAVLAQPGPPPLPSSFWGTVRVNGQSVPTDTIVSAWISGTRYAWATVMTYPGWGTVYALDVPGDQTGTPAIEGGKAGDTIVFKIGDLTSEQIAKWRSGTNTRLDLTATKQTAPPSAITLQSFVARLKCFWILCR